MKALFGIALLSTVLLAGCAAPGDTHTANVKMNTPTAISSMSLMGPGCEDWGAPTGHVVTPPRHGEVKFLYHRGPLQAKDSKCNGEMMTSRIAVYVPNKGFKGTDSTSLKFVYINNDAGGSANMGQQFTINVQ
ncbi:hypothetical protein WJT86_04935 [Microvirga sp. W0021]|uniref:Lipoprotein n=1 Tax=Hohaiivirga grylli TaxID=3133970 RepID=A0ABV0BHG6_9HYPH